MDIHEVASLDFCAQITRLVLGAESRRTARARNAGVGSADASAEEGQLPQGLSGSPGRWYSGRGVGVSPLPDTDSVTSFQAMGFRQTLCLPGLEHDPQQALHKYC